MANVFLDETTPSFKITAGDPSLQSNAFIGGTALPLAGGTVSLSFQGTSAAFYGELGSANFSTTFAEFTSLTIDGGSPSSTTIPEQGTDNLFYQTPTLSSGSHTVSFFTFSNLNFDFFVITAAKDTNLSGQTLIVDDTDSSIVYSGDWTKNSGVLQASTNSRTPYGGSTRQTNSVGSSATFSFAGSSISVHGVINDGPISVSFIMDGVPLPATQFPASNGNLNPTFTWYSSDSLTPGNHILQMKVAETSSAFFTLDYILYQPSFSTLASKPAPGSISPSADGTASGSTASGSPVSGSPTNGNPTTSGTPMSGSSTSTSTSNSNTSTGKGVTNTSSGSPTSTDTSASNTPSGNENGTSNPGSDTSGNGVNGVPSSSSKTSTSRAVIVGAVVGSLAVIIILALLFWLWRKRAIRRRGAHTDVDIAYDSSTTPIPFPPPSYVENRTNASSDLLMQIGKPTRRIDSTNTPGPADEESGMHISAQSSSSLLRVDPFNLPAERAHSNPSIPQSKLELSRLQSTQNQQPRPSESSGPFEQDELAGSREGLEGDNPRVQELVTELQRELASSSSEGRDALLRGLLDQNANQGRGGVSRWATRQSTAPSTLPPPYEPDADVQHRRSGTIS